MQRVRLPRHFRLDHVLRPYSAYEAEGAALLRNLGLKHAEVKTDWYIVHHTLSDGTKKGKRVIGKEQVLLS